ncbi:hypothetical protein PanWU01x14_123910 [Parasponia andersonii]|uniref:Uncharacterized protein n=1 Tax=Parasponia andersonii TaxID=3476 RepID=A0A2P5CTZ6_PARAD|nr:hypothetical protein PanWU01x14_123910 [Parasponia andersonii]
MDSSTLVLVAAKMLSMKKHSVSFVKTVLAQIWGILKGLKTRIMGLLRDSISESNIRLIASKMGKLVEIDAKLIRVFFVDDYVWVKMEILVHKPFSAGLF